MNHEKFREAFLQGEEKEAANLFRQLLRQSIRMGLLEAMQEEVEALCGPRYRPDPQSPCHRAGSESGVVYMDGGREQIQRPRVRHKADGEVRLGTYEAASSSRNLFDQIVASVAEGLPVTGWALIHFNVKRIEAARAEAVANYRQAVLAAVRDVESSLAQIRYLGEQTDAVADALTASSKAVELIKASYDRGSVSYLELLDAERTRLQSDLAAARVAAQRHMATVRLIKALGGAW